MDFGVSKRFVSIALAVLLVIYIVRLTPRDTVADTTKSILSSAGVFGSTAPDENVSGFRIRDKVAVLSDTQYTSRMMPLILHFHAVLGPDWPIVVYTSEETAAAHLLAPADPTNTTGSAVWRRALARGAIQVRTIPPEFNMTTRDGVNVYLSRPWLWEQLAPARHVLVFQTDSMICANAHRTVDDFLEWDFDGAPMHPDKKLYNGGLSIRNRTMMMEILAEGKSWEADMASGEWTEGGEDIWFSRRMDERGGHLPTMEQALEFSCEHEWHTSRQKQPMGYHKVHKVAHGSLPQIAEWCPEIALAAPGALGAV